MAEGGPLPEDQVNKDSTAWTCQLLECPICLEQMRIPKSLPCSHSFCEECLSTYIVRDLSGEMAAVTSFQCPVCRKMTSPVNHSERKETWAVQFPTSSLVQYLSSHKDMADAPLICGFCKKTHNKETPATMLCKTKGMLFCDLCKVNVHDIFHEVCDIVTLNEVNHDTSCEKQLPITCSKHNLTMDYHCEIHKLIGCEKCISTDHRRCDKVATIKEYCSKMKTSKHDDMDKSLEKAVNCIELMVNALDRNQESLQQCQDVGLSSISNLRKRINSYLDMKQEEITIEILSKCKAAKAKVDLSKQKCSRLRAAIQKTKEASRTAQQRDDQRAMIQLFHRGQTEIRACNDFIGDIAYPSKAVSIVHNISTNLITINPNKDEPLGKICVQEQPCIVPDGIVFIENVDSLSDSRAKLIKTYRTSTGNPRGIVLLSTGNIVVSNYKEQKLTLLSSKCGTLDTLTISGYPNDVCSVDDDTVAVAVSSKEFGIHVVKVENSKLTLSTVLKMPAGCQGLTFTDGKFMVSTSTEIHSVTMDGKVEKVQTTSAPCQYLASDLNKNETFGCVPISTVEDIYVTRLSHGIQIYGFGKILVKNPGGMDVDREGNVYVCGQDSNNVVQVSANGTKVRELLTSKDGVDKPRAVSVCGDKFVVTNESDKYTENEFICINKSDRICAIVHVYQFY